MRLIKHLIRALPAPCRGCIDGAHCLGENPYCTCC